MTSATQQTHATSLRAPGRSLRQRGLLPSLALLGLLASVASDAHALPATPLDESSPTVRFVDLNGDGLADKLVSRADGLTVSIYRGAGIFEDSEQQLPAVQIAHVLVGDLDGDGLIDLYLVSAQDNVALVGDGAGRFTEATEALGLTDSGHGLSAERIALGGPGAGELLLHNVDGDVLFWTTAYGFERDASTPARPSQGQANADLRALEQLVAQAAELLALDPKEELVIALDDAGRPEVSLGTRANFASRASVQNPSTGSRADSSGGATGPGSLGGPGVPPPAGLTLTTGEQAILDTMSLINLDDGSGNLVNPTIRFSGVNVQVVSGLGATNGNPNNPSSISNGSTVVNGVGNLIVGYNELGNPLADSRIGSHNVVLGQANSYTRFGGLVGARENTISGPFSTVSGGRRNQAKAPFSSVGGGKSNTTKGKYASVSGGWFNTASGAQSSVSGGQSNKASGVRASVSGGQFNVASGKVASVSGGYANLANGYLAATVSGGAYNTASGTYAATVSGGEDNTASGTYAATVSGGGYNTASGTYTATVSGGAYNAASGHSAATVSGGRGNTASGTFSSVSGGNSRTAAGAYNWVAGLLLENN
ncbi:MAG: hypothetical protein ACI9EF_001717 [Pseudohongiellaceae bacterium]|jgi:hypothetical protein